MNATSPSLKAGIAADLSRRYRFLDLLGEGGMGKAYRVMDRLTGQMVALKQGRKPAAKTAPDGEMDTVDVSAPTFAPTVADTPSPLDTRGVLLWEGGQSDVGNPLGLLALAQEFAALASLRHPNIVRVLDYGFDSTQQPYFTMELVPEAQDIMSACKGQPIEVSTGYLIQALEALVYLHRRGVIHRDIKPPNVLVSKQGRVKVLDFGIALAVEDAASHADRVFGTVGFIAPELLQGSPVSVQSDLYAFGVVLCLALFGVGPFHMDKVDKRRIEALTPEQYTAIYTLLMRLMASNPSERYATAREVIDDLAAAVGQAPPAESAAARESFLQAARFVGREAELTRILTDLGEAQRGHGRARLLGGESGVGKSRLLQEVRTRALISGVSVVHGQALSHGGSAYQLWRDVAARLALAVELTPMECRVLKPLIPHIGRLAGLQGAVEDAPILNPEASQARLIGVLESLLRRQPHTTLVILEDLHWAGEESLKTLAVLRKRLEGVRAFILASHRDDERSEVAEILDGVSSIKLTRLGERDIETLSEAILGASGRRPEVVEMLRRETEGSPFFLVEILRLYAESAGGLDRIAGMDLSQGGLLPGGVASLVERKLAHLSDEVRAALRLAAVVGRDVDVALLQQMLPDFSWERELSQCADAAVLSVEEGEWRFAHDKIREHLLGEIADQGRAPAIHKTVAEAIEALHGDAPAYTSALAHHWAAAGDAAKEAHFSAIAGEQALEVGAFQEALRLVGRALELRDDASEPGGGIFKRVGEFFGRHDHDLSEAQRHKGHLEGLLCEAHSQLGAINTGFDHAKRSLAFLGEPMPTSTVAMVGSLWGQAALRMLQLKLPGLYKVGDARDRDVRQKAALIQVRTTELCMYRQESLGLLWSGLRALNLAQPVGQCPELAYGYTLMGVVGRIMALHGVAEACEVRAAAIAEEVGSPYDRGFVGTRIGASGIYVARWDATEQNLTRLLSLAEEVQNPRQQLELFAVRTMARLYRGALTQVHGDGQTLAELASYHGDNQATFWGHVATAYALFRMGRVKEAAVFCDKGEAMTNEETPLADAIMFGGLKALVALHDNDGGRAERLASQALEKLRQETPVMYWTQKGIAAVAEVFLTLWRRAPRDQSHKASATEVCKILKGYGRKYPFGRPFSHLYEGKRLHLLGKPAKAISTWQKGLVVAETLQMPYERGLMHLELAEALASTDPAGEAHRASGTEILEGLGRVT